MKRFAAINCTSCAKLVSAAVNCFVQRFGEKVVKFPKNKLNKSFGFLIFARREPVRATLAHMKPLK